MTIGELYREIGLEIIDPANAQTPTWRLLNWINSVLRDASMLTNCLQKSGTITGNGSIENHPLPFANEATITILDFSGLSLKTVTVNATILTENAEWFDLTSNALCAESLASAIDGVTNVNATAKGAVITIRGIDGNILTVLLSNAGTSDLLIDTTSVHTVLSVNDQANMRSYESVPRREYQSYWNNIIGNSTPGMFVYNVFGFGEDMKLSIAPLVADSIAITVEYSHVHPTLYLPDERPLGLLNNYDRMIVKGVASLYWDSRGELERSQVAFESYFGMIQVVSQQVGINPIIKPELSSLYRFVGQKMQELSRS